MKISVVAVVVTLVIISGILITQLNSQNYLEVTITPVPGADIPGCEETDDGCFTPNHAVVNVGGTVTMSNTADVAHAWLSGDLDDRASMGAVFESDVVYPNQAYEWIPKTSGEYPYFCVLHPWMTGLITVR